MKKISCLLITGILLHFSSFSQDKADRLYALNQDFNTYTPPGLYEFDGVMPNAPNGSPNFRVLSMGNDQRWTQMAFQWDANRVFFRRKIDNSFSDWNEYWHSGNFSPSNYLALTGGNITGNIGIGTENNSIHKLAVNGSAIFKKVVVKNGTPWPDYVFDSSYQLPSLESVSDFIVKNKHLPGIPSASEAEANGLDLGDMCRLQQEKIEQLTLYLIKQQELLNKQEERLNQLYDIIKTGKK
jgi:hypothetical protein